MHKVGAEILTPGQKTSGICAYTESRNAQCNQGQTEASGEAA